MTALDSRGTASAEVDTPDAALLVRVANGDRVAARVLIDRLAPRLLRHVTRTLGDRAEAEDIVQETFLRLWKVAPEWRQGEAKVSTWAFRVAINMTTDKLRARRATVDIETIAEPESHLESAVSRMTNSERLNALDAALATLPERQRQAVSLRHIEELSNPEIAEIMDIGVEAVESLTARGKRALRAALEGKKEALGYSDEH